MPFVRPTWPDGATCAVTLTFDNFGESFDLLRYGHAGGANADGIYAARRGIERVLDLLEKYKMSGTFFVEGWNAAKYANLAREVEERGHEIAAHGWMHERWSELDPVTERDLILRTTETLTEVLGHAPRGWRSPSGLTTTSTLSFLHEAGYVYDSSMGDEDIPYALEVTAGGTEIMELPWSWPLDDAVYFGHPGTIRRPSDIVDMWIDEFEAARQLTGTFMLVCHPRFSGRPSRILTLERLLDHVRSTESVWITRCADVADHARTAEWLPHYPAPAVAEDAS
jgi:peptidoglycan/xylan/chitin deacetylase (PgdA/CDA1 family)